LDKISKMDPEDLMQLLKNKDELLLAIKNGDLTDPKVQALLRKLKEVGLSVNDIEKISNISQNILNDLVAKSDKNKKDNLESDAANGKLTLKDMQEQLAIDQQKKNLELN